MSVFDNDVHRVRVVKPTVKTDLNTGATHFDYATPATDRTVEGFIVTRGGTATRGPEGQGIPFDAVFHTRDLAIAVNDLVELTLSWLAGKFVVVGTEPKSDIDGDFDHNEVLIARDATL